MEYPAAETFRSNAVREQLTPGLTSPFRDSKLLTIETYHPDPVLQ